MKQSLTVVGILAAFVLILLLIYRSYMFGIASKSNGFDRKYPLKELVLKDQLELAANWNQIAGANQNTLWISGIRPGLFLLIDLKLWRSTIFDLAIGKTVIDAIGPIFWASVDSCCIYLFASNMPAVLIYNRFTRKLMQIELPPGSFSQAVAADSGDIVLRKYLPIQEDQGFFKINSKENKLRFYDHILPINHDAGISTDGQLHWDQQIGKLVYLSYYSNVWFSAKKDFSALTFYHTIDTVNHARIEIIRQGRYLTSRESSTPVNNLSVVSGGKLYVQSGLRSEKEVPEAFNNYFPIDIYDIISGTYQETLAIPKLNRKLKSFFVQGNCLYAQYPSTICLFQIPD